MCYTNIDGACVYGGSAITISGSPENAEVSMASLPGSSGTSNHRTVCSAAGLFAVNWQPYTTNGWVVTQNGNAAKYTPPLI